MAVRWRAANGFFFRSKSIFECVYQLRPINSFDIKKRFLKKHQTYPKMFIVEGTKLFSYFESSIEDSAWVWVLL